MTEENQGLEKYISQFARRFGKRNEGGKRKEQGFTAEQALEKFRFLSAAGAEGQKPMVTFSEGNTLILNDQKRFPPGTILREAYFRKTQQTLSSDEQRLAEDVKEFGIDVVGEDPQETGPYYMWYCIGNSDKEKRKLTLFESASYGQDGNNTSPVYVMHEGKPAPEGGTWFHQWEMATDKKGVCEFTVGEDQKISDRRWKIRGAARTVQVDIMTFGEKEKVKVKVKERKGLKELVPQRVGSSI